MSSPRLVPARYYAAFAKLLRDRGLDSTHLFDVAGISSQTLEAANGHITLAQMEVLVTSLPRITDRSDLALDLAKALKLTSHSRVSYGILSSPTMGYCLRLVSRYFSLIHPAFRLRQVQQNQKLGLILEPVWPMSHHCLVFHLELISAAFHWEVRELLGGDMPAYETLYSFDAPAHAGRYAEMREMTPLFGWDKGAGCSMWWPASLASRPLTMADPNALKIAEQQCSEMLEKVRDNADMGAWVSMMLREAQGSPPSLNELARTLNLSTRTLDRYLKREGESFRDISKRVRHARACDMLANERWPITRIAFELGYTDQSNFARAFRREAGMSPQAWRADRGHPLNMEND